MSNYNVCPGSICMNMHFISFCVHFFHVCLMPYNQMKAIDTYPVFIYLWYPSDDWCIIDEVLYLIFRSAHTAKLLLREHSYITWHIFGCFFFYFPPPMWFLSYFTLHSCMFNFKGRHTHGWTPFPDGVTWYVSAPLLCDQLEPCCRTCCTTWDSKAWLKWYMIL